MLAERVARCSWAGHKAECALQKKAKAQPNNLPTFRGGSTPTTASSFEFSHVRAALARWAPRTSRAARAASHVTYVAPHRPPLL